MANPDYTELFNVRGRQYHAAMARYPAARDAEFGTVVEVAGVRPGESVADIPCGGGYLAGYLPPGTPLWSIDSSDVFADCFRQTRQDRFLLCPIDRVPLADAAFDHIISIAGLHHVEDRRPFWRECARLLRAGGTLTVADVRAGSPAALFLDSTVDRHTSTGHKGIYFDRQTVDELDAAGFRVELAEPRRIGWRAETRAALGEFCHLLFGLENIDVATLTGILQSDIGMRDVPGGVELDWELMLFRAIRAP